LGCATFSYNIGQQFPREFIGRAQPEIIQADIYPLNGGQVCTTLTTTISYPIGNPPDTAYDTTSAAGNKTAYTGSDSASNGLQFVLDKYYMDYLDSLHAAASDSGIPLWVISQAFGHAYKSYDTTTVTYPSGYDSVVTNIDCNCNSDEWYTWRRPTRSELSAMTFLAMCYDIKGLLYYRYDATDSYKEFTSGVTDYTSDGSCDPTPLWGHFKEYISPYVKAYGGIYASDSFYFDRTYKLNDSTDPPSGALIKSINSWSDSTNPDSKFLVRFHQPRLRLVSGGRVS